MKVINLFGGPGAGKSTFAAELFVALKKQQKDVELVTEYAKDMVWEGRDNILADQLYILAKQNRKLSRLLDKGVEYAISDSPLPLGIIYDKSTLKHLPKLTLEVFKSYTNLNFFLGRREEVPYRECGRVQKTLEEAVAVDFKIRDFLEETGIQYVWVRSLDQVLNYIEAYEYEYNHFTRY